MSPIMIARTVIQILFMFMEILAFGGYIFIVTLTKYIMLKRNDYMIQENNEENKTNNTDELLEMLRNELGYQVIYQYCQMEFSLENLLFWKDLEELRTKNLVMTVEERKQTLNDIYDLYIKNNSERQLNIANKDRKKFLQCLEIEKPSTAETEEIFKLLYDVCMTNLSDTAIRLKTSELYQDYMSIRATHQELTLSF
jgi:hypothetical protein